jgi:hypothetical protein
MRSLAFLLAVFAAVALPTAAGATPSTPMSITVLVDFSGPVPQGTFTASAPLCSSGTFVTEPIGGGGGPLAFAFVGRQHFTCADDSGAFTIEFHPQNLPPEFVTGGPWSGLGGTGAYAGFRGHGDFSLVGFISPVTAVATYTGVAHFD